jgi:hypothetical protein
LFLVELAALELQFSLMAWRQLSPGDALRPAWLLIALSAGCHLAGTLCVQVLSADSAFNPLVRMPQVWSPAAAAQIRHFGLVVGGSLQMALLGCGLLFVLRAFHRVGLGVGSRTRAGALLLCASGLVGGPGGLLVSAAMVEAFLVARSVWRLGWGLIARCWGAVSFGLAASAGGHFLPRLLPADAGVEPAGWMLALLAGAALALGPAYQVTALRRAGALEAQRESRVPAPAPAF